MHIDLNNDKKIATYPQNTTAWWWLKKQKKYTPICIHVNTHLYTFLYVYIYICIIMNRPTERLEIHQKEKCILFDTKLLNFQIVYC